MNTNPQQSTDEHLLFIRGNALEPRHVTDGVFAESKESIADMCRPMAEVKQHAQSQP
jgi:hypothetical protein